MASRAVGAQAIGLFKLVFYPPCHVCRLRSIRKSTPPQGRSSARPLLVALIETGWVVSDVSWNNQATRHVKFSAHHPSGTHICHENDLIGHLQPLMKRSTPSKRRIATTALSRAALANRPMRVYCETWQIPSLPLRARKPITSQRAEVWRSQVVRRLAAEVSGD